jgi:hypothetical protein
VAGRKCGCPCVGCVRIERLMKKSKQIKLEVVVPTWPMWCVLALCNIEQAGPLSVFW